MLSLELQPMELEVLRAPGVPESSVISVRAGGTRRQCALSALDRPFKFPSSPEECGTFKVEVLDLLGSASFPYDPSKQEHSVGLETAAGQDVGMQVVFNLRRATVDSYARTDGEVLSRPGSANLPSSRPPSRDEKKEQAAREYLEKHGLTGFMQNMMQCLMKDRPEDPFAFLQKQVTKRMVSDMSNPFIADEQGLGSILATMPADGGVSVDQLAALEREAADASEKMRQDNKKLREAAAELKAKYWKLLEDNQLGAIREVSEEGSAEQPDVGHHAESETPQVAAYREIASMQKEVTNIAEENQELVEELSRMRATIEAVRGEIDVLAKTN